MPRSPQFEQMLGVYLSNMICWVSSTVVVCHAHKWIWILDSWFGKSDKVKDAKFGQVIQGLYLQIILSHCEQNPWAEQNRLQSIFKTCLLLKLRWESFAQTHQWGFNTKTGCKFVLEAILNYHLVYLYTYVLTWVGSHNKLQLLTQFQYTLPSNFCNNFV